MRDSFPRHLKPGDRLTADYYNRVNATLNRVGQFSPGSTLNGMRTGGFDADLAKQVPIIRPFRIVGYELTTPAVPPNTDTGFDYSTFPDTVDVNSPTSAELVLIAFETRLVYRGQMLRWNVTLNNFAEIRPTGGRPKINAPYRIFVDRMESQFVLPEDIVIAMYDETRGGFTVIDFPTRRAAISTFSGRANAGVELFRVYYGSPGTILKPPGFVDIDPAKVAPTIDSHIDVQAAIAWNLSANTTFFKGQKVWLNYIQPMRAWFVEQSKFSNFIHFRLVAELTEETEKARATPEARYDNDGPGFTPQVIDSQGKLDVYNPRAGCTGHTYRFKGVEDCRGQAIWSDSSQRWVIWQLDCIAPGDRPLPSPGTPPPVGGFP